MPTLPCGCDLDDQYLCEWHQTTGSDKDLHSSDVHPPQIRDDGTQWSPLTQAAEKSRAFWREVEEWKRQTAGIAATEKDAWSEQIPPIRIDGVTGHSLHGRWEGLNGDRETETRITDPTTGGQKGQKLQRFSLIPAEFLWALAEHYGKGAEKYEDRNWERGYHWSLTVDALERHYTQWKQGESRDPETGSSHLIAMAWHVVALFIFERRGLGTDDVRRKA